MCQQAHISYHEAKYVFQFTQKLDMKWEKTQERKRKVAALTAYICKRRGTDAHRSRSKEAIPHRREPREQGGGGSGVSKEAKEIGFSHR